MAKMKMNKYPTHFSFTYSSLLARLHALLRDKSSSIVIRHVHELTATLADGSPTIVRRGPRPAL